MPFCPYIKYSSLFMIFNGVVGLLERPMVHFTDDILALSLKERGSDIRCLNGVYISSG